MTSSVKITNADFNGSTWDGSPFDPRPAPLWLIGALSGAIAVQPGSEDYAWWRVKTNGGIKVAGPGDIIHYDVSTDSLIVQYQSDDAWQRFKHLPEFAK